MKSNCCYGNVGKSKVKNNSSILERNKLIFHTLYENLCTIIASEYLNIE